MATKERDLNGGMNRKGHGLCVCCDAPKCGKRKGPYAKKHQKYLNGQKQRVSWRGDSVTSYNNDYITKKAEK